MIITPEFVEDLCDSIRETEESLAGFIAEVTALEKTHKQSSEIEDTAGEPKPIQRQPVLAA